MPDPAALRAAARQLDGIADELATASDTLVALPVAAAWRGPAADRLQHTLRLERARVLGTIDELRWHAGRLRWRADQADAVTATATGGRPGEGSLAWVR